MGGNLRGVVANVLDRDIVVSEFDLHLCFWVHFQTNINGKCMKPFIPTTAIYG